MLLVMIGHNCHNFLIWVDELPLTQQVLATFAEKMIKHQSFDEKSPEILKKMKYYHGSKIVSMPPTGHIFLQLFQQKKPLCMDLE